MTAPSSTTSRPAQWVRTSKILGRAYVKMLTLWFWAIALPVIAVILFVISLAHTPQASGVAFSHQGSLWFPFSIAITMVVAYLPLHVANGMTRRSFATAAIVVNVGVGIFNAVIATLALLLERPIYQALGWFHGGADGRGLEVFHAGVLTYSSGLALLFIAGQLSGCLVGITYYRTNGWLGTALLPLSLLPLAAVSLLGLDQSTQWAPWGASLHLTWGWLLSIAVLTAAALAFHRLARGVTIASKKA